MGVATIWMPKFHCLAVFDKTKSKIENHVKTYKDMCYSKDSLCVIWLVVMDRSKVRHVFLLLNRFY